MTVEHPILEAAEAKFGLVTSFYEHRPHGYAFLVIKRNNPVFSDKPYMTIRGSKWPDGTIAFYWGSYDLTEARAMEISNEWFSNHWTQGAA